MTNKTLDKYVNKIGQFWLKGKHDMPFAAQIVRVDSSHYELTGSMIKRDLIEEIRRQQEEPQSVTFYGVVEAAHISLFDCYTKEAVPYGLKDADDTERDFSATFSFGDALIGATFITYETGVSAAIVHFEKLEEFINHRICNFDLLERRITFNQGKPLKHDTKKYSLEFVPGLKQTTTGQKEEFIFFVSSKFIFPNKISIKEARMHIAQFRMLLSMLKLHYLDIDGIELYVNWNESDKNFCPENVFQYYLNYMPERIAEQWPVPFFCLQYDDLAGIFTEILNNWFCFQETAEPIVEMFYQILINKSHDINLFLNLVQAMEVFSNRFREKEVKQLLSKYPRESQPCSYTGGECKNPRNNGPALWHRVFDLFNYAKDCFKFDTPAIEKIARWIRDTRHYYTHYDTYKKEALTQYEKRARINRLMQYLLTILIYNKLGIEMDLIGDKFYHTFYKSTLQQVKTML